ncbi:MAG: hypothetical protein IID61_07640, partial [SAR324 cluster bacterium]|nr:hypothetical protein [SAR324 cluster bacterium]
MKTWAILLLLTPFLLYGCAAEEEGGHETDSEDNVADEIADYSVGGTLSGLTGTVVLQNNDADGLTLNSNGSFTFATAVADLAGYAVTVLT